MSATDRMWELIMQSAYEPGDGSEEGAQMVSGKWWYPAYGCDSVERLIQHIFDVYGIADTTGD